jgi:glycerol-3-phosphate cytidylyltransferase-like family protein
MDIRQYNNLKKQAEDKYQKTIILAEKQRKEGLEAIERVWDMLNENQEETTAEKAVQVLPKAKKDYGSLTKAVKKALKLVSEKFTKRDIILVLPQISPEIATSIKPASLNGCLVRLEKQGIIKTAKSGSGSIPTVYKKIKSESSDLFEKG